MVAPAMPAPSRAMNSSRSASPAHWRRRQVRCVAEQGVEQHRTDEADQQNGPPADAVGDAPPERREEELHQRKDRQQAADDGADAPVVLVDAGRPPGRYPEPLADVHLAVARQQRQDDAETEQIDDDDQEDDEQGRARRTAADGRGVGRDRGGAPLLSGGVAWMEGLAGRPAGGVVWIEGSDMRIVPAGWGGPPAFIPARPPAVRYNLPGRADFFGGIRAAAPENA